MSRAFVREQDLPPDPVPVIKGDDGPNYMTRDGLASITVRVQELELAQGMPRTSDAERFREERELEYLRNILATAVVRDPPTGPEVEFGSFVNIERRGQKRELRIVGQAEADAAKGLINSQSPLARALLGKVAGETIEFETPMGTERIVILSVPAPSGVNLQKGKQRLGRLHTHSDGK
jgi:transcription elongation GreA/GreB family factor